MLSFALLGQTVLLKNGMPLVKFRSQKEAALLIYLAQTGQSQQRDVVAELLWDATSTQQALSNLRTVIARLRKQVGDALIVTRKTIALSPERLAQVDSVKLLQVLEDVGEVETAVSATTLQKALETYHGDFLSDFNISNAPRFNDWAIITREHIRRRVISGYKMLGQFSLTTGDAKSGIEIARRWLNVDALDEAAHTLLIQHLIEAGKLQEARTHYKQCVELLQAELMIAPPDEMTALIESIRPTPVNMPRPLTAVQHNLPTAYNQFFNRETVQQEIHTRLDQPWCRFVTITGQGGVGKTRLATTIASSRLSQYRDGAWLVELADIDPDDDDLAEAIAVEIATTLDLRLSGSATPEEQLRGHLQHKQMLLVLDNFEHILKGVQLVLDIVHQCENVQLIITSREALKLQAEWTVALKGLSFPNSKSDEMHSDAVDLFIARQAQQHHGAVSDTDMIDIRTICNLVEGLPLAIELAAAHSRYMPFQEIAECLRDSFDMLTTSLRDVPQRHRGLQVVFEMSWQTLTPALQLQLARLSIFRGGFTLKAARQITEANITTLSILVDKSLLSYDGESGRYVLHPVIRSYAAVKRESSDPTPQKYAHYYLSLLAQHTEALQKDKPQDSMKELEPDIDNIRSAWQMGLSERNSDLLANALTSLSIYYQLRGLAHEGESVMQNTMSVALSWEGEGTHLAVHAGLDQARFLNRLGQYQLSIQTIQTVLKLANDIRDRWTVGMAHVWWGESLWRSGEFDTAETKLNHALAIAQKISAQFIVGWCYHQLGIVNDIQGRFVAALNCFEKASEIWQALNNQNTLSVTLNSIGLVYRNQGELTAAKQAMEQALAICVEQDNRYLQAMLFSNLSTIYLQEGDHFGAHYYLQLGLELAIATGSLHSQSDIYVNIGKNYRLQGEYDLAQQHLERGLQIAKTIGNRPSMVVGLHNLADVLKIQGNTQKAETIYNQALLITQQDGLKSLECELLISLATLLNERNSEKAKQYSKQLITLAKDINDPSLIKRAEAVEHTLNS